MNLLLEGISTGVVRKTDLTRKITLDGITETYPVYRVKLDILFFNDKNDRIATWISKYKVENSIDELDTKDKENYNNIVQEFIYNSNPEAIKKTQKNIEIVDQREAGVVLQDGRIIDGNRRFTCLRNLSKNNLKFNYFETVILDIDFDNNAKQIKMLELMIQHGEESKVDYNPIDRLVGIHNVISENKLLTVKEYSMSANITENEVKKQIELSELLVEFLETINSPKQFYMARQMELYAPIVELYAILRKTKDENVKENIKYAVFTNFLMQPHGDMTRFIRKIKPIVTSPYIVEFLEEQLDIAEVVLEKLPPVGEVTLKIINEKIRTDKEIIEKLDRSLTKSEMKVKAKETRNKPVQMLEKAGDSLEVIDVNIFRKLNSVQITDIVEQLNRLDELIESIREATLESETSTINV